MTSNPRRFRQLLLVALVALMTLGVGAWASQSEARADDATVQPRQELVIALSHFHDTPALADIESLMSSPVGDLTAVARDTSLARMPRQRALQVLATLDAPEVRTFAAEFLAERLADDDLPMARRAVDLVRRLATRDPAWAMDLVEPLIAHEDFGVREHTVAALGVLRRQPATAERAEEALMQLVIAERNPAVQQALTAALDDSVDPVTPLNPGDDVHLPRLPVQAP